MSEVIADMAANVWKLLVEPGSAVREGDTVVILESMKMEIPVTAEVAGTVSQVCVAEGDTVDEGAVLVTLTGAR
jgi:acetyl-CoA carboxylase biotin carboxyl carrier protein